MKEKDVLDTLVTIISVLSMSGIAPDAEAVVALRVAADIVGTLQFRDVTNDTVKGFIRKHLPADAELLPEDTDYLAAA